MRYKLRANKMGRVVNTRVNVDGIAAPEGSAPASRRDHAAKRENKRRRVKPARRVRLEPSGV